MTEGKELKYLYYAETLSDNSPNNVLSIEMFLLQIPLADYVKART